jgi:hypothetical protein
MGWLAASKNSPARDLSLPWFVSMAISRRLMALNATGSARRTAASRILTCSRDSFLPSASHRTTIWVSKRRRASNLRSYF